MIRRRFDKNINLLSFDVSVSHILYYLWDISLAGMGHLLSDRSPIFGTNVPRDLVWHYWWLSVNWDCFIGEDISLTNVIGGPNLKHWYYVNVTTFEVAPIRLNTMENIENVVLAGSRIVVLHLEQLKGRWSKAGTSLCAPPLSSISSPIPDHSMLRGRW